MDHSRRNSVLGVSTYFSLLGGGTTELRDRRLLHPSSHAAPSSASCDLRERDFYLLNVVQSGTRPSSSGSLDHYAETADTLSSVGQNKVIRPAFHLSYDGYILPPGLFSLELKLERAPTSLAGIADPLLRQVELGPGGSDALFGDVQVIGWRHAHSESYGIPARDLQPHRRYRSPAVVEHLGHRVAARESNAHQALCDERSARYHGEGVPSCLAISRRKTSIPIT